MLPLPQKAVGLICNIARTLNNIHPAVPLLVLGAMVVAAGWSLLALLS